MCRRRGVPFSLFDIIIISVISILSEFSESAVGMDNLTDSATPRPSAVTSDQGLTISCADVRQIFGMRDIGPVNLVPDSQIKGEGNSLCVSSQSCCTPKMEERYKEATKKDLKAMLQTASSYLKTLISTSTTKFRENVLDLISASENQTQILFRDDYKMEASSKAPVHTLYTNLRSFIQGPDISLEDHVTTFFNSLFPLVYHHIINPKLKDFSDEYKECLRETREEIQPFGDVPRKLTASLVTSFKSAKVLLQAMSLGVEVINSTEHMDFGSECSDALVKLSYCPHCLGRVSAKPCSPYCLNVVRGCLAQVAELDRPWADFVNALERMASGFVGNCNTEEILAMMKTRISEAILHAMENGPDLSNKVRVACGQPIREKRETQIKPSLNETRSIPLPIVAQDEVASRTSTRRSPSDDSMFQRLQNFARKLVESKSFYGNLADTLCNEDSMSNPGEQCWNGHAFGEYTKTVAGIGVSAQKYNPELKLPKSGSSNNIAMLVDKLAHIKETVNKIASSVPQSDSYVVEGSGSGSYFNNQVGDDEEYDAGSGSGDWYDSTDNKTPEEKDFDFADHEKKKKKLSGKDGPSGGSATVCHLTLLFFILFFLRQYHVWRV